MSLNNNWAVDISDESDGEQELKTAKADIGVYFTANFDHIACYTNSKASDVESLG